MWDRLDSSFFLVVVVSFWEHNIIMCYILCIGCGKWGKEHRNCCYDKGAWTFELDEAEIDTSVAKIEAEKAAAEAAKKAPPRET